MNLPAALKKQEREIESDAGEVASENSFTAKALKAFSPS